MLEITVGEAVLATIEFLGENGQPLAATGVRALARSPGGQVRELTVEPDGAGTGRFKSSFVADEVGVWRSYAECAGPTPSVTPPRYARAVPKPF